MERAIDELKASIRPSADVGGDDALPQLFGAGLAWLEDFIMQPHVDLGRSGAVCPFARTTHRARLLYFAQLDVTKLGFDDLILLFTRLSQMFFSILDDGPGKSGLLCLAVFLEGLEREDYWKWIDVAHSVLKPVFMANGLMLGEFHPNSVVPGARSNGFYAMRSPVPVMVVRAIAPHDVLFIDKPGTKKSVRLHELECFLAALQGQLSADVVSRVRSRIRRLRRELFISPPERAS